MGIILPHLTKGDLDPNLFSEPKANDQAIVDYVNGNIVNSDLSASAAIAYSKLALTNSILAGDLTSNSVTTAKIANDAVTVAKLAPNIVVANASSDLTLATSVADVAGCTTTTTVAGDYLVRAYFYFQLATLTSAHWDVVAAGRLSVNGVEESREAIFSQQAGNTVAGTGNEFSSAATVAQEWYLTGVGASQVVKLRALRSTGSGGAVALLEADETRMVVQQVA